MAHPRRGDLRFGYRTRNLHGEVHPDMHARLFVNEALDLLKTRRGIVPIYYHGIWGNTPGMDQNFNTFWTAYREDHDMEEAVRQTFSARALEPHGFTRFGRSDILAREETGVVEVTIWRK